MRSQFDYESAYLKDGKIVYLFNAGSGGISVTTPTQYNDGRWHKVVTRRAKTEGMFSVVNAQDFPFYISFILFFLFLLSYGCAVCLYLECIYLTRSDHLADTKPHLNPSLDFS